MDQNSPKAPDVGGCDGAKESVLEQRLPESLAGFAVVDSQPRE